MRNRDPPPPHYFPTRAGPLSMLIARQWYDISFRLAERTADAARRDRRPAPPLLMSGRTRAAWAVAAGRRAARALHRRRRCLLCLA